MKTKERPILSDLINSGTSDIEKFQNKVIRPVIKMQHHLLILLFEDYIKQMKIDFSNLTQEKQNERISIVLQKDINFKNILLGCIIGHFSSKELIFFSNNSSDLKRRIIQIIKQRLQDFQSSLYL